MSYVKTIVEMELHRLNDSETYLKNLINDHQLDANVAENIETALMHVTMARYELSKLF